MLLVEEMQKGRGSLIDSLLPVDWVNRLNLSGASYCSIRFPYVDYNLVSGGKLAFSNSEGVANKHCTTLINPDR